MHGVTSLPDLTSYDKIIFIFQNFIVVLTSLIAYLIPDVPDKVKKQIRREAYIANEIVIQTESRKARGEAPVVGIFDNLLNKFKFGKGKDTNGTELRHRGEDNSEITIERDPDDKSYI